MHLASSRGPTLATCRDAVPDRVQDAVWWHVDPLGFVGAEPAAPVGGPVVHRLGHLTGWLDDVVELGAAGARVWAVLGV